MYTLVCMYRCV